MIAASHRVRGHWPLDCRDSEFHFTSPRHHTVYACTKQPHTYQNIKAPCIHTSIHNSHAPIKTIACEGRLAKAPAYYIHADSSALWENVRTASPIPITINYNTRAAARAHALDLYFAESAGCQWFQTVLPCNNLIHGPQPSRSSPHQVSV